MNAYDTFRATIEGLAVATANTVGLNIVLPNEQYQPPADGTIYGEFWHRFTTAAPEASLGGGRKHYKCRSGIIQFTLYAPEKTGDGPITRIADQIEQLLSSTQHRVAPDGYVIIRDVAVDPIVDRKESRQKPLNGNFTVLAWAPFEFHYRNPEAAG